MDYERGNTTHIQSPCLEHSGMVSTLTSLSKELALTRRTGEENCRKLDQIKLWIIGLLGTTLASILLNFLIERT